MMHHLTTEQANPTSAEIDTLTPIEIVRLMNAEDKLVALAVEKELVNIARGVEAIADRMSRGGRLLYLGAGTSGRLGVLDASECPPTFRTSPDQVVGIIAGGLTALTTAVEGAEDDEQAAEVDLRKHQLSSRDVLVGIATSGRTPYVCQGLRYARSLEAFTIGLTCNASSDLHPIVDLLIAPIVGPEIISGSTRLKAGTATKMILNMLTTGTMVRLGKTYGHWMVDLRATNQKLRARSLRIVSQLAGIEEKQAERELQACDGEVKTAILTAKRKISPAQARALLVHHHGQLRAALSAKFVPESSSPS